MISTSIDSKLKELWPDSVLGCVQCRVNVRKSSPELLGEIDDCCRVLKETFDQVPELAKRDRIARTRSAYKAFGKEPSRYRNSAEAMCRRILQGKGLYQINNVVECNNLFSIRTGYSLGAYDVSKIHGSVIWKVAEEGAHYQGIGKDQINVEYLPVFADSKGPFGNPTSDSVRTRITENAQEILMVIFGFAGTEGMENDLEELKTLLQKYCGGSEFEIAIVE